METRRLGRLEHQSSVLIYGAASLGDVTQDVADESLQFPLDAGINHFDVAASYGDAEIRVGKTLPTFRDRIFLASKTGDRDEETAWASINRSLERMHTDHLDLIQMHGVNTMDELDLVLADDGAVKAAERAKAEGLVKAIGITGHTHAAPTVHAEALRRYPFDSVLTPLNYRLWNVPGYADSFAALVAEVQKADAALMTIKMIARRNWLEDQQKRYATWYEPFDEQRYISAAISWLLGAHPEVTGLATAGETKLLAKVVQAEKERVSVDEAAALLGGLPADEYASPFENMPW